MIDPDDVKSKKSPFEKLDKDFRDLVDSVQTDPVRLKQLAAEVSLAQHANLLAMKLDEVLQQKKEAAKEAGFDYAEATKANKLKIKYIFEMLDAGGKL